MAAGAQNLFGYQQLSKVPTVGAPKSPTLLPSGTSASTATLRGVTQPSSGGWFGGSTPSVIGTDAPSETGGGYFAPGAPDSIRSSDYLLRGWGVPNTSVSLSGVTSPNYDSSVFTEDEVAKIAAERKKQEKINQDKMNKMMELATMGDDRQATAPRPQMVGAGSGMRNFQPIASGPLKRPDDILNTPFLQGLYS